MSTSTTTAAALTAEQVSTILTKPLEQRSVFLAAGPAIFDTNGSPVRIPAFPASEQDALEWVGENELIPEVDPEFGETELLPSTMKSVKTITRYSNELARQSIVSLDKVLQDRLVADVAGKLDAQFLSDQGDGVTTPRGLFAYAGVEDVAVSGEFDVDTLLAAQGVALESNVDLSRLALFVRPGDLMALRGLKDNDGRYLLQWDATEAGGYRILGMNALVSAHVPEGRAAIADMSQIAVARDLDPTVKILTERYADYDQQAIRVVARYDAGPLNPAGIVTISGIGGETGGGDDGETGS